MWGGKCPAVDCGGGGKVATVVGGNGATEVGGNWATVAGVNGATVVGGNGATVVGWKGAAVVGGWTGGGMVGTIAIISANLCLSRSTSMVFLWSSSTQLWCFRLNSLSALNNLIFRPVSSLSEWAS